ncbi:MAG: class I poly(R)-hydroxyalkanoic acid synthase [Hyphomicrobiaceae bacterium]|nr:class I poly(R)-hydroxyalkanoic acid synthase [Hyphomicrobiaceae bacterium]
MPKTVPPPATTAAPTRPAPAPTTAPPVAGALVPYWVQDPEAFSRNVLRLFEQSTRAWGDMVERADSKPGPYSPANESANAAEVMMQIAQSWMSEPARVAEAQTKLYMDWANVWNTSIRRSLGETVPPVVEPAPGDARFKDPEWSANPYFDFWKQMYLVTSNWAENQLANTELDERTRLRAQFYTRLVTSAMSPANIPALNPEVLRATFATNAENLVQGMAQFAEDMERSGDLLQIRQTDVDAFRVGENLALTPGKVVFQNELIQLIQYSPTTKEVHETPLLIVPPWINKYYILDLTPPKSLIRYVVSQGYTVFVISWVNPDERLSHKTFEDYMLEGVLTAAQAIKRECNVEQTNILGYCVGGTLVASTLSYLAAVSETPFKSATFLTTQVDFEKAGDLLVFIDDDQLADLTSIMTERGYLDGSRMANVFNMMRPKDLIWPYVINNYMLGKKPMPFDLLYWNQDSTRMTAANHAFYLGQFYNENRLSRAEMTLAGHRLDPRRVTLPIYELATRDDHIAPAVSVFKGAQLFSGPVEFVLAGSGHIAGVINPPDKVKYQYWTGSKPKSGDTLDGWIGSAKETPGSWWPHWMAWLAKSSGDMVPARSPGAKLGTIEDAPGSYVRVRHLRPVTPRSAPSEKQAAE